MRLLASIAAALTLASAAAAAVPRPVVVQRPVRFDAKRIAETEAYARRHYGLSTWHVVPHVIVEHYTATDSLSSVLATFSADVPDVELHELPGICAQFVIDRDGTIYQLAPATVLCRHTVGLNDRAIGIEHVGTSDAEVLGDAAQMRSSLALTLWLMQRYHVPLADVIGHAESLTSPFHRELVPSLRCQTHGDFPRPAAAVYRTRLAALAAREGVHVGPPPPARAARC